MAGRGVIAVESFNSEVQNTDSFVQGAHFKQLLLLMPSQNQKSNSKDDESDGS